MFHETDSQSIERYLRSERRKQRKNEKPKPKPAAKKSEKTVRVETLELMQKTLRGFGAFVVQQQQQMVSLNFNSFNNLGGRGGPRGDSSLPVTMQAVLGANNVRNTGFE